MRSSPLDLSFFIAVSLEEDNIFEWEKCKKVNEMKWNHFFAQLFFCSPYLHNLSELLFIMAHKCNHIYLLKKSCDGMAHCFMTKEMWQHYTRYISLRKTIRMRCFWVIAIFGGQHNNKNWFIFDAIFDLTVMIAIMWCK